MVGRRRHAGALRTTAPSSERSSDRKRDHLARRSPARPRTTDRENRRPTVARTAEQASVRSAARLHADSWSTPGHRDRTRKMRDPRRQPMEASRSMGRARRSQREVPARDRQMTLGVHVARSHDAALRRGPGPAAGRRRPCTRSAPASDRNAPAVFGKVSRVLQAAEHTAAARLRRVVKCHEKRVSYVPPSDDRLFP